MSQNKQGLINHLVKFGKTDKFSWEELAAKFQFHNGEAARHVWAKYRKSAKVSRDRKPSILKKELLQYPVTVEDAFESTVNKEKGTSDIVFSSPKKALSDDEIFKECNLSKDKWSLVQIYQKKRASGFVYTANFKAISKNDPKSVQKDIEHILNNYKSNYIPLKSQDILCNTQFSDPVAVYISMTDSHLDRLTVGKRGLDDAVKQYLDTVEYLILKSYCCNLIDEICYVIGNDLFDSDTYYSTTTDGTQQHSNVMYDESYEKIFDMQVKAICKLKQFCNKLHIKFVPGNHDRTKGFFLVHALNVYFQHDKNIIFDRTADNTKVYTYGENFIGMHHGDTKPEQLPLYFATRYYKEWGKAHYHEIGIGDKHTKKGWELKIKPTDDEYSGVRIFMTPSLCDNNQWEKSKMFDTSIAAGICRIYSKKEGKCGEFEKRLNIR